MSNNSLVMSGMCLLNESEHGSTMIEASEEGDDDT